jgi:hypothetical protein
MDGTPDSFKAPSFSSALIRDNYKKKKVADKHM